MNEENAKPFIELKNQGDQDYRNAKVNNLQTEDVISETRMESRGNPKIFTPRGDEGATLDVGNKEHIFSAPRPFEN